MIKGGRPFGPKILPQWRGGALASVQKSYRNTEKRLIMPRETMPRD
jgi:hypothetical protein